MNPQRRIILLATIILGAMRSPAAAQCDGCGVTILQLNAGTQPLGLGGAYVTGDGPNAIFYNPAQVGSAAGSAISVTSIAGATLGEMATSGRLGRFGIGAGVRFVAAGIEPGTGDVRRLASGAFVARAALETAVHGVFIGGAASYVTTDLSRDDGGVTFDVGAAIRRFGLLIGLSAQNLGPALPVDFVPQPLPTRVSLGVALPQTSISTYLDASVSAALSRDRDGELIPQAGGELVYNPVSGWQVTARVGARRVSAQYRAFGLSGFSLGASFGLDNVSLDYTFLPAVTGGRSAHSFGLRIE